MIIKKLAIYRDRDAGVTDRVLSLDHCNGSAYWFRSSARDGDQTIKDFLSYLLPEFTIYAVMIDVESTNQSAIKIREFLGAFGKNGLLHFNKNLAYRKSLNRNGSRIYFDISRLFSSTLIDLDAYMDKIFYLSAGMFFLSGRELSDADFDEIKDAFFPVGSPATLTDAISVIGTKLIVAVPVIDNDCTKSLVLIDKDESLDRVFCADPFVLHDIGDISNQLLPYGDRLSNGFQFSELMSMSE